MEKPAAGRTKRVNNQGGRNRHTMRPPCPAYFFFLGPLGLEVAFRSNPFRKWVVSNFSKKTNNPNPSPIGKRFGLYGRGAGGGTRTHTVSLPADFESATSTNSITPANLDCIIQAFFPKCKRKIDRFPGDFFSRARRTAGQGNPPSSLGLLKSPARAVRPPRAARKERARGASPLF